MVLSVIVEVNVCVLYNTLVFRICSVIFIFECVSWGE